MERTIPAGEAARILGVNIKTLQRWDREGRFIALRSDTNRRMYSESQIRKWQKGKVDVFKEPSKIIAYCRVSSNAQKADLKNQRKILEEFVIARGLANVEFIEEVGGGLNFKRKHFLKILEEIGCREVKFLILAHKDRLVRFGFEWFEYYAKSNKCEFLILNQERLSPEQEMVQDLMTIIHCFSSRLYGLRNYRKKLREILKTDAKETN